VVLVNTVTGTTESGCEYVWVALQVAASRSHVMCGPVPVSIRKVDARNAKMLAGMEGVTVFADPRQVLEAIRKN
jgi:flavoprotein